LGNGGTAFASDGSDLLCTMCMFGIVVVLPRVNPWDQPVICFLRPGATVSDSFERREGWDASAREQLRNVVSNLLFRERDRDDTCMPGVLRSFADAARLVSVPECRPQTQQGNKNQKKVRGLTKLGAALGVTFLSMMLCL
jgi:hypothetical protein